MKISGRVVALLILVGVTKLYSLENSIGRIIVETRNNNENSKNTGVVFVESDQYDTLTSIPYIKFRMPYIGKVAMLQLKNENGSIIETIINKKENELIFEKDYLSDKIEKIIASGARKYLLIIDTELNELEYSIDTLLLVKAVIENSTDFLFSNGIDTGKYLIERENITENNSKMNYTLANEGILLYLNDAIGEVLSISFGYSGYNEDNASMFSLADGKIIFTNEFKKKLKEYQEYQKTVDIEIRNHSYYKIYKYSIDEILFAYDKAIGSGSISPNHY